MELANAICGPAVVGYEYLKRMVALPSNDIFDVYDSVGVLVQVVVMIGPDDLSWLQSLADASAKRRCQSNVPRVSEDASLSFTTSGSF